MIYTDDIVINYLRQIGNDNPTESHIENARNGLTNALKLKIIRKIRDEKLAKTDWWASSDLTMSPEQLAYRQALRDITSNISIDSIELDEGGNVLNVNWPIDPTIDIVEPE